MSTSMGLWGLLQRDHTAHEVPGSDRRTGKKKAKKKKTKWYYIINFPLHQLLEFSLLMGKNREQVMQTTKRACSHTGQLSAASASPQVTQKREVTASPLLCYYHTQRAQAPTFPQTKFLTAPKETPLRTRGGWQVGTNTLLFFLHFSLNPPESCNSQPQRHLK